MKGTTGNFQGVPPLISIFLFLFGQNDRVDTRQAGVWIEFHFSDFFRMFSPNPISIIRIVEYSMISVLEYLRETLANLGLPKA